MKAAYPDNHEDVLASYPHATPEEVEQSATDLASDRFMGFGTWKWLQLQARTGGVPVYRYRYEKLPARTVEMKNKGIEPPPPLGAPHACDIEYAMGNLYLLEDKFDWLPGDYQTSATFSGYLVNFIKTGNPTVGPSRIGPGWIRLRRPPSSC